MKYLTLVLTFLATQFLTGCFQTATAIRVKPDGSGTLIKVFSMTTEAIAQARQMQQPGSADGKLPTEINETRLKDNAAKFGEGVVFVSVKKLVHPGREGFVATYAFTDITKLKLQLADDFADTAGAGQPGLEEEAITFEFTKGPMAELAIHSGRNRPQPLGARGPDDQATEELLPMMSQVLKEMRVSLVIDIEGIVVKTNASNRHGQRITLLDAEFGKLLADPVKLKAMAKIQNPASPEGKALLKTIPGVQIELEDPVRVSFR